MGCTKKSETVNRYNEIFIDRIKLECYCTKTNLYSHEARKQWQINQFFGSDCAIYIGYFSQSSESKYSTRNAFCTTKKCNNFTYIEHPIYKVCNKMAINCQYTI